MLAMTGLMLAALAVITLFPETRTARALRRWLIETPARILNRVTLWRILFYGGLVAAGLLMTLLFEAEGLMVYGMMAPEVLAWAVMIDVGVLIDALLITAAVLASNGLRVARDQAMALTRRAIVAIRARRASASRRPRPARPRRPVRKTDDERPGWAVQPGYRAFSMA